MNTHLIYPGSFAPPTYGHFRIALRAAALFPKLTILCSTNPDKTNGRWFSEDECKAMWGLYDLPENVTVLTFAERFGKPNEKRPIVMVRGIRDENDMPHEQDVMKLNHGKYGVDQFFYLFAEKAYKDISSAKTREAAEKLDFQTLAKNIPPAIITILLKKVLGIRNLFMVVGRPGGGKSTFLKMLSELDPRNVRIDTDTISKTIRPIILNHFGNEADLVDIALNRTRELDELIAPNWFRLLADALRDVPKQSNIFLEIPYGLKPEKAMYRFVGHRILHIGCKTPEEHVARMTNRGDRHHARFLDAIPDRSHSIEIARKNGLEFFDINSSGNLEALREQVTTFNKTINDKEEYHVFDNR